MNKLNKATIIISRIMEVFCWVGSALSAAIIAVMAAGKIEWMRFLTDATNKSAELTTGGYTMRLGEGVTEYSNGAMILFFITVLITLILSAMIARNVCLIFKTTEGMTSFSNGKTPFQKDNIRMVREIGIFLIAIPVVELIMSVLTKVICGYEMVETSVNLFSVWVGLVALALSGFFAYGMQLQEEVDGLV